MHKLYFIPNGTILLYTRVLLPLELVEHVRYTDERIHATSNMEFFLE